jgi:hypothetical protein
MTLAKMRQKAVRGYRHVRSVRACGRRVRGRARRDDRCVGSGSTPALQRVQGEADQHSTGLAHGPRRVGSMNISADVARLQARGRSLSWLPENQLIPRTAVA